VRILLPKEKVAVSGTPPNGLAEDVRSQFVGREQTGRTRRRNGEPRTRESLLSRLRGVSDEESWREFYYTYWDLIFRTARKYGLGEREAEEVVQDTLVTLARTLRRFKYDASRGSFKSWLMNQTRWKVLDYLKRQNPAASLDLANHPEAAFDGFKNYWEEEWRSALLSVAIERLKKTVSPHLIQIFSMCVINGAGVTDTAARLHISKASVYMAVFKMKRLCKKQIEQLQRSGF